MEKKNLGKLSHRGNGNCSACSPNSTIGFRVKACLSFIQLLILLLSIPNLSWAWHDETHLAIARAAGYAKWYNATGADMAKLKAGAIEGHNHHSGNPPDTVVTPAMVLEQANRYNQIDEKGHLYGAIVASLREYIKEAKRGKYGEYHLAFCAHYVGDLSMPLHNVQLSGFNKEHHTTIDGIINDEVLENLDKIEIHPISIRSEEDLAIEVARLANASIKLGHQLEADDRLVTKEEAYAQISRSASLFKAIIEYAGRRIDR